MRTILPLLISAALVAACSESNSPNGGNPPPATAEVTATEAATFSPSTARVAIGGTVTWNFEGVGHNVTFDDVAGAPADISGTNANTEIARTFGTAGSFPYVCTIHPGMAGTVLALSASSNAGDDDDDPLPGY